MNVRQVKVVVCESEPTLRVVTIRTASKWMRMWESKPNNKSWQRHRSAKCEKAEDPGVQTNCHPNTARPVRATTTTYTHENNQQYSAVEEGRLRQRRWIANDNVKVAPNNEKTRMNSNWWASLCHCKPDSLHIHQRIVTTHTAIVTIDRLVRRKEFRSVLRSNTHAQLNSINVDLLSFPWLGYVHRRKWLDSNSPWTSEQTSKASTAASKGYLLRVWSHHFRPVFKKSLAADFRPPHRHTIRKRLVYETHSDNFWYQQRSTRWARSGHRLCGLECHSISLARRFWSMPRSSHTIWQSQARIQQRLSVHTIQ